MAQVRLNIADIILALEFEDPAVAELVGNFYRGFVTDREPVYKLKVRWDGPLDLSWPTIWPKELPSGFYMDAQYHCSWGLYDGHLDFGISEGSCEVRGIAGLQRYLWAIFSVILPRQEGLLIHAASVVDNMCGVVFPAPSGVGKSTLIRNSGGRRVLSDEGTLLRFRKGRLWVYGSPYRSDNFADYGWIRLPVGGLFFLQQWPEDAVMSMAPAHALERLLSQTFLFSADAESRVLSLELAERMVQVVRASVLRLRNGGTFWGCVTDAIS